MKKLCYFLMFLLIGTFAFAQQEEQLPEKLWKEIIEMKLSQNRKGLRRWHKDIKVGLEGNYTKKDSIDIADILRKLDNATKAISISFSTYKTSNLQINFSEIHKKTNIFFHYRFEDRIGKEEAFEDVGGAYLFVQKTSEEDKIPFHKIEIDLAKMLFVGFFITPHEDSGYDIFRNNINLEDKEHLVLTNNDLKIVEEIYKEGFEEKLLIAEDQYKEEVLEKIADNKALTRDSNLWWVKNPIALIVLPVLILILLFLFISRKIKRFMDLKIKINESLKFTLINLVVLFFIDIIVVFSVSFYDFLITPKSYGFSFVRYDTVITTFWITHAIIFPFLYLFRSLEFKIQKTTKSIFTKTGLMFLSTGFLPFITYLILVSIVFTIKPKSVNDYNDVYLDTSYMFLFLMSIASVRALISYFIFKERNLVAENENKLSELRALKADAELKSLQSQINPHFLYNSLNSIASLAPVDADKTQKMAHSLSDMFKYSINRKGKKMSTVMDEVEMVKTYLEIEKIRFEDRLQFTVMVDKSIENKEIPLFLIQPLVENAVKHGISQNEGAGEITLEIKQESNQINISVSDNGPDFPEGLVSGHGLQTVYDLLRLTYGDQASLNWTNTPEKKIMIIIPEIA